MTARDEIRSRLRAAREARRPAHGQPPPRYDEVWADGVAWARARSRGARRHIDRYARSLEALVESRCVSDAAKGAKEVTK